MIYVTFMIRVPDSLKRYGIETKRYAIECKDEEDALRVAYDINSLDGTEYIKINRKGRIGKNRKIISCSRKDYLKEI